MRRLVTGRRAKEIDAYTMNVIGIPSMVLMERAALGVARMVQEYFQEREHAGACAASGSGFTGWSAVAVCGTGNNGRWRGGGTNAAPGRF